MGDMDKPGSYPFCPKCAVRFDSWYSSRSGAWFCTTCQRWIKSPPADDRHREAMRLACCLEDDDDDDDGDGAECRCTCTPCQNGQHLFCNFRCDDANWRSNDPRFLAPS